MQLTAVEDVAAPAEKVFSVLTDFDAIQRQALRRGVDVRRKYESAHPRPGDGWVARFRYRGKAREANVVLDEMEVPQLLRFKGVSGGLDTDTVVELLPLSKNRTRISLTLQMTARTLAARLLIQSLKLTRGTLTSRFRKRMSGFARDIEDRLGQAE